MEQEIVKKIQKFIDEKRSEKQIINRVIRDDVFSVLGNECKVLYYSLNDDIEGCHILKPVNGKLEQFVFINTAKVVQEQVWTAAHELGHVWNVDQYVRESKIDCMENGEKIVGRFAAEFLMPESVFRREVSNKLQELEYEGGRLSRTVMVELVTYLMNFFCTPHKSVILRFIELGYVQAEHEKIYLDGFEKSRSLYEKLIQENQYTRLEEQKDVYTIGNIQKDIDYLEKRSVLKASYARRIRELFRIDESISVGEELEFEV